jgi:SAM-dependent methyltransferase
MAIEPAAFEAMLHEATSRPMTGWDFDWLGDRMTVDSLPWDFHDIVAGYAAASPDLLDMGTGGGEWLAALPGRPARTVATEGWRPNLPVARDRLGPLGIEVVEASGGPGNVTQPLSAAPPAPGTDGALPFPDRSFHLISNRHESFVAAEVARLLAPGGHFVTQQVGDQTGADAARLLGLPIPAFPDPEWTLDLAVAQLTAAGLEVVDSASAVQDIRFADAAALGWYLASVPWLIPGFSVANHADRLRAAQRRVDAGESLVIPQPVFRVAARRPG